MIRQLRQNSEVDLRKIHSYVEGGVTPNMPLSWCKSFFLSVNFARLLRVTVVFLQL